MNIVGEQIGRVKFADFSAPRLAPTRTSEEVELLEILQAAEDGTLVLDRDQYELFRGGWSASSSTLVDTSMFHADFEVKDELRRGRERSDRHSVIFGHLTVESQMSIDAPDYVAVKPHFTAEGVVNEVGANNYVNGTSPYERAFMPLGAWKKDGKTCLLTLFDEPVQSFDNILWANEEQAKRITPAKVAQTLSICAYSLGFLHGTGVSHGDAQPKNIAADRRRVRFIDLEEARLLEIRNSEILLSTRGQNDIVRDANALMENLVGYGEVDDMILDSLRDPLVIGSMSKGYHSGVTKGSRQASLSFPDEMRLDKDYFSEIAIGITEEG